jgi:hypothetical protein
VAGIVFGAVVTVNSGGIEDFISTGINEQTQINLVILREIGQFLLVALGGVAIGLAKHYNDCRNERSVVCIFSDFSSTK